MDMFAKCGFETKQLVRRVRTQEPLQNSERPKMLILNTIKLLLFIHSFIGCEIGFGIVIYTCEP